MLINGININNLGIKLYNRIIKSNTIDTAEDWVDGDIQPTIVRQQDRFKQIQLAFLVLGNDEEDAFLRISQLTAMLKQASIQFDDINLIFKVNMQGSNEVERLKNGNFIVRYNLTSDYAIGEKEIYTTDANLANSFKLTILYYQNSTTLLATENITIRASSFKGDGDTPASIGINIDKYLPDYCNHGVITNIGNLEWTYNNLQSLGTLIINYAPITYNLTVEYFINSGTGVYEEILSAPVSFTYFQLQNISTIGQLIDSQTYRPEGYISRIGYNGELTVEDLLLASPIFVYYDKIENELTKTITVSYYQEADNNEQELIQTQSIVVKESQFYDGLTLEDIININAYRPSAIYYNEGYIQDHSNKELITYETTDISYTVRYARATNTIFVEYYLGTYPNWYRLTTSTLTTKYQNSYEENFDLDDLNINVNRYHTNEYELGRIYNRAVFETYEDVMTSGVIQVYYTPIDYPIVVQYYTENNETPVEETITINALDFINEPILGDIINLNQHKPEGYKFDTDLSYSGEVTLSALTQASPISIYYEEIEADRTMNIVIRYKQELTSALSTINTSLITVNESDCVNGVRLRDLININLYKPDYYEDGFIDGASLTTLYNYDDLASNYTVVYMASSYSTPVRYYVDEINDLNWIGSSSISYRVIDFSVNTTLYDFGLNLNAYKPSYCDDGVLDYNGAVNFSALRALQSLNIVYEKIEEPIDDGSGIDYPHRFLFLQHNDLGGYENLHPDWTMNHAYINTGITADDMSKLTVIMECERVDNNVPLHDVIAGYGYLFGSSSGLGQFYMRFNNQTQYGTDLTGVNLYEARAGYYSNSLVLTEENAVGFGPSSGIYSSERDGYSYATFTYTNALQSESAQMPYPLYLFANNNSGNYADGIAGIGIYGCRIFYDGVLVRDMIPVQYYDKIGDQVAPSNCLYDKITQTFFEDATGMNSFNIRDDERYTDTNLEHQIGSCIVNYYKGEELIKTVMIWFRGNDFNQPYDAYTKFFVDENQPAYYYPGVIEDFDNLVFDFDNMNGSVYNVHYAEMENRITVNYYRQVGNTRTLIETETIPITEKDFYQAPTFGDIVRLNKYKPEGFETNFVYEGTKVSLTRVLNLSPYDIIYTPITGEVQEYTTTIRYIKKVYGVRTYETIGEITLTLDDSDFRDGEYIDYYIDLNAMKPAQYYEDGITYQWYEMDERLDTPDKLKSLYIIAYPVETQYIPINYYTDDVDAANLIASSTWAVAIDDFDPEYPFYIVDNLPNEYINRYRPLGADGGVLQNSNVAYTWDTLMEIDEIAIVYESIEEPNDPESAVYDPKVLYFTLNGFTVNNLFMDPPANYGGKIPYIDLGYKPKEIGRLRVEMTTSVYSAGLKSSSVNNYSFQSDDYTVFFGYWGCADDTSGMSGPERIKYRKNNARNLANKYVDEDFFNWNSEMSKGCFGIKCRVPVATGWVYTAEGPQFVDGQIYYTGGSGTGIIAGNPVRVYDGISAYYRKGCYADVDLDYNTFICFHDYGVSEEYKFTTGYPGSQMLTDGIMSCQPYPSVSTPLANPYTIIMDAYNEYFSLSTYANSNTPYIYKVNNTDVDIFENREQPKGTLSLFRTTNPTTGKINLMPFDTFSYAGFGITGSLALNNVGATVNPYTHTGDVGITQTIEVISSYAGDGTPIYETRSITKNINYASFTFSSYPQISGCFVWSVKIYDQDRLVRDLIPVAKGDKIYDYTMPENGLFDLITEIFFGNSNMGGTYLNEGYVMGNDGNAGWVSQSVTINPEDVYPLYCVDDILYRGKITTNYYDYDNTFLNHQFVRVPYWFNGNDTTLEDILQWNDFKPDDFHLDGWLDLDVDYDVDNMSLAEIYELGTANVYYRLRTFTKTVVYYQDNVRIGSRDLFYSLQDIEEAEDLDDLGIDVDLFYDENFAHGRVVWDESIIASDNMADFIDAPSPIVVYDKLTQQDAPNLLYVEYYRGGAYEDSLITLSNNPNYLNCNLTARVLNPNGAIKYLNHYHSALYEDETYDYFIPYQVLVKNRYAGLHNGPGRKYKTLAMIIERDTYTIIQERNGWGRLKEYPNAWIMLNQTEPIVGPGQNPEYDTPTTEETSTIAFGEYVTITKMTIDRLWCYAPEVDSWIKAEDISFNQAGKLYNGLKIEVIDLDNVDWTNAASLADIGIDIQKWKLRFHNNATFSYSGEYNYQAFSNLHSIDIVYPETIYTYSCIYYQDNKYAENELGRSAFSCSISDWNPDWDTFIATSWLTVESPIYGKAHVRINQESQEGYLYTFNEDELVNNGIYTPISYGRYAQGTNDIPIIGSSIQIRSTSTSSPVTYLPVDTTSTGKTIYLAKSDYVGIDEEFGGYEDIEANPVLYRDTEITLNWDYFGFERNKFQPTGYSDGIYLWNPRSWDIENVIFSFQELIRCGTQYVVYPPFNPNTYKLWTVSNQIGAYDSNTKIVYNPGLFNINLANSNNDTYQYQTNAGPYDVYLEGEFFTIDAEGTKKGETSYRDLSFSGAYGNNNKPKFHTHYEGSSYQHSLSNYGVENKDSFIISISNHRFSSPTVVVGLGNAFNEKETSYYYLTKDNSLVKIEENTNLQSKNGIINYLNGSLSTRLTAYSNTYTIGNSNNADFGVFYRLISYNNFEMIHYYVPVPKGLWYNYNGETLRILDNGLFDLLTGELATSFRIGTHTIRYRSSSISQTYNTVVCDTNGADYIYQRKQDIHTTQPFNLFEGWSYNTTTMNNIVKVAQNVETIGYKAPDEYAIQVRTLAPELYLPVSLSTNDTTNNVVGTWYKSCDQWINSNNVSLDAGNMSLVRLTENYRQVGLIPSTAGAFNSFKVYIDPESSSNDTNYNYGTAAQVRQCYYSYTDASGNNWIFDGAFWIPTYETDLNIEEVNKNYVVVQDIPYYTNAIASNDYKAGMYNYGDRITILYKSVNNPNYGYTGQGWIEMENNVSLVE